MPTPVSFYSPEGIKKQQELARQQMMAQLLMGQKAPQLTPTRFTPRESPIASIAPVVQNLMGAYLTNNVTKGQQELQAAEMAKVLEKMGGGVMTPGYGDSVKPSGGPTDPGVDPRPQQTSQLNPYGIDPTVAAQAYMSDPAKYADTLMEQKKPTELQRNIKAAGLTPEQTASAYGEALLPKEPEALRTLRGLEADPRLAEIDRARRAASATNVSVNTEKSLYGTLADKTAGQYADLFAQAQAAPEAIARARRVRELLEQTPYTGAAADWKLAVGKGAKALGFDYAGDDIQNTELLARELGQNTLDSVKSSGLAGSQGLTEGERRFLLQVVGGTIALDSNTLKRTSELNERMAHNAVRKWNDTAGRLDQKQLRTLGMTPVDIPEADSPALKGGLPKTGEVVDGWEFLGGDPANQKNWRKR